MIAGVIFALLTIVHFCLTVLTFSQKLKTLIFAHLIYPFAVRRFRFIGPWSRANLMLRIAFVSVNIFCSTFRVHSLPGLGTRAANLAIANMVPLFFGPHLGFLASLLGTSLDTFHQIHGSFAQASVALGTVHTVINVIGKSFSSENPDQLYGLIVSLQL